MTTADLPRCPVCRKVAWETSSGNIFRHLDKAGRHCPTSGYPYYITQLIPVERAS